MTILMSGASGMLGTAIGEALRRKEMRVRRLVRSSQKAANPADGLDELFWNPSVGEIDATRLDGIAAAIHLSGANIAAHRWTPAYKREMTESRITTTRVLSEALAKLKNPPEVLVSASAVGFYGDRGDETLDEDSPAGTGFLPELCLAWEAATRPAGDAGIRVVHLRFGTVIGPGGGAVAKLTPVFRLGLGGPLGNGRQWMSWISLTDSVSAVMFALQNSRIAGPVNFVAPTMATNAVFMQQLGRALHRPALLSTPAFALRLAIGQMADEALLASTRAIPKRLLNAGFTFSHPTLELAFAAALAK